jgi:hypothetical protein
MTRPTNEEIPLLDDDEAMEAIATLRARGYSPEQVQRAMEHQTSPPEPTVLTVEEALADAEVGCGLCYWGVEGGTITCTREELEAALEDAYDPMMSDWPTMVQMG